MAAGLLSRVEEQFLLRVSASTNPSRWVVLHHALTRPLLRRSAQAAQRGELGGRTWSVVSCGRPKRFRWLLSQLFDEVTHAHTLPVAPTIDPTAFDNADLLAVEVHPTVAPRFRSAGWMVVPETVSWHRGVGDPYILSRGRAGRALRSDLQLVARGGYTMSEGRSRADWVHFRDHMLLPYSHARFGDAAWQPSLGFLRAVGSRGRLLFAVRNGCRVSGILVVPVGRRLWAPILGVADGSAELRREGAVAALYKLLLEWATQRDFDAIDIGRTRPSLADSVAWYKAKWGFRLVPDPLAHLVAIRLGPDATPIQRRLLERRIVVAHEDGLRPVAATPTMMAHRDATFAVRAAKEG